MTGTRKPGPDLCSAPKQGTGPVARSLSACRSPPGHPAWKSYERSHHILTPQILPVHLLCAGASASIQATSNESRQAVRGRWHPLQAHAHGCSGSGHSVGRGLCATPTSPCSLGREGSENGAGARRTSEQPQLRIQTVPQAQGFRHRLRSGAAPAPHPPCIAGLERAPFSSWPFDI